MVVAAACWLLGLLPSWAGDLLDRIRNDGMLHCAAVERPGYAAIEDDKPAGRAADLCRAVAERVLGPEGRFALRLLDLDSDYDRVRKGEIELAFLETRAVAAEALGSTLIPVGDAYQDRFAVLLPATATAPHRLADLGGRTICFMIGDPVWPRLEGDLKSRGVVFRPFGFSEEVEMKDAYNVGRCGAMAGAASFLDDLRTDRGVNHLKSRFVDEDLGADPVEAWVPSGNPAFATLVREILAGRH